MPITPEVFFAEILLPLPVKGTFTYRIPREMHSGVKIGIRVAVQFGSKKIYTGLVLEIHSRIPQHFQPKYILSILDEDTLVNQQQIKFWEWISSYYLSTLGEVMAVAMPSALKLASETQIILAPDYEECHHTLNEQEYLVVEALQVQEVISLTDASKIVERQKIMPLIKNMIEKKIILLKEEVQQGYRPRIETYVTLREEYRNEQKLGALFDQLEKRAYKQLEIIMSYIKLTNYYSEEALPDIKQSILLKDSKATSTQVKSLVKKEVLETYGKEESRLGTYYAAIKVDDIEFTAEQQQAIDSINQHFADNKTTLLHGVTGSGKTEIYIRLIQDAIDQGKQVLYLLPEIALTTQIINRLRKYFGDQVGVYHSKFNPYERVEIWNEVLQQPQSGSKKYQVVIGARSATFLPFSNLGLVIVDEEHDNSFKQHDPAPRYNGRDAAIVLGKMHHAHILLGTATPSIESYFNAKNGKYGLTELKSRYSGIQLPEIMVADLKVEKKRKLMQAMFSSLLIQHMDEALKNKEQIILFQNRRGFSLRIECEVCNWIPQCKNCDVSMIYHKKSNLLKCHYCGHSEQVPERCPSCGSHDIFMHGFGTEQVEEELTLRYPKLSIKRMDLDTTRSKHGHQKIIQDFTDRKIDILIGTQMVTKGLDFENVNVVGILSADSFLSYPDFRAFERGFQLMAQVSGRAGRKNKQGKVIIQSFNPYHDAIRYVIDNNYNAMYQSQLAERKTYLYPPYYRMVKLEIKHQAFDLVNKGSYQLGNMLRKVFGKAVLGPEYPVIPRIRNQYIKNILIKLPSNKDLEQSKSTILQIIEAFKDQSQFKVVRISINVDPI